MSHMPLMTSPAASDIINEIQLLRQDLQHSKQTFEYVYREFKAHINRTESLVSRLLLKLRPETLTDNPTEEEQEEQEVQSKQLSYDGTEVNGAELVCPHEDCKGITKHYARVDNLERHYTQHLACKAKCAVCKADILIESDRKHHIKKCLKGHNHESLADANKAWSQALRDAKMKIGLVSKKRLHGGNDAAPQHRKAAKFFNSPQKKINAKEQNRAFAVNSLAPHSSTGPHAVSTTPSISPDRPTDVPERAPFCNGFTMETCDYFGNLFNNLNYSGSVYIGDTFAQTGVPSSLHLGQYGS